MFERAFPILHLNNIPNSLEQIRYISHRELLAKYNRVRNSFIGVPIYLNKETGYQYSQFALTADIPFDPTIFEDAADLIINSNLKIFAEADIILSEGDRGGGPLAQAIGRKAGLRVALSNWHKGIPEGMPDITVVKTEVGFSGEGYIVVSGIKRGQKVVLVDDLLSTGGTSEALIKAVEVAGGIVVGAFFPGEKVNKKGRENLNLLFPDLKIMTLVSFISEIKNGATIDADL